MAENRSTSFFTLLVTVWLGNAGYGLCVLGSVVEEDEQERRRRLPEGNVVEGAKSNSNKGVEEVTRAKLYLTRRNEVKQQRRNREDEKQNPRCLKSIGKKVI
ncbi:hypothetical protein M5K25_022362 [Dendrobium thyrsiflorum]|uniref:Secreted protein n=1 Tax=Dendrobium thyrsiflorum TaxID=117978 RepID=A0ABD0U634_DENTH